MIKMKIVDVKGLVLSEMNYSDSSKILNVLTKEYGCIGILSKGCRNLKSKLRGASRKLLYGTFHFYYKEKGLSTLISIDVIQSYSKTLMNLKNVVYASFILDFVKQVAGQCEERALLELSVAALNKIEEGMDPVVITNILELKLLSFLGVSPNLDCCAVCGRTDHIVSVSPTAGGLVCSSCYQQDGYYSEKAIQLLRMYYYVDIEKISKISVHSDVNQEINRFLEDYYDRYTGIYLKSKKVLQNVSLMVNENNT